VESGESMDWSVVSYATACIKLLSPGCIHELQDCKQEQRPTHSSPTYMHFADHEEARPKISACSTSFAPSVLIQRLLLDGLFDDAPCTRAKLDNWRSRLTTEQVVEACTTWWELFSRRTQWTIYLES
jgi:hypothetical protein